MESCATRLCKALSIRGMKQIDLSQKTGIPKSAISQYCSGAFKPKQKRLFLLAEALNVDEAWLMGLDVPMEHSSETTQPYNILRIAARDGSYQEKYLTDEQLAAFKSMLDLLPDASDEI